MLGFVSAVTKCNFLSLEENYCGKDLFCNSKFICEYCLGKSILLNKEIFVGRNSFIIKTSRIGLMPVV